MRHKETKEERYKTERSMSSEAQGNGDTKDSKAKQQRHGAQGDKERETRGTVRQGK